MDRLTVNEVFTPGEPDMTLETVSLFNEAYVYDTSSARGADKSLWSTLLELFLIYCTACDPPKSARD